MGIASEPDDRPRLFVTTHWTMVLNAGDQESDCAERALEELCRSYWFPLYAYSRRAGHGEEAAKDLTQGFFAKLIEKNYLGIADRRRGRFRWFLLTAFKGFLANEWDRQRALKRGGGKQPVSIDQILAEEQFHKEPSHDETPDSVFEKRWALTLIAAARERLQQDYAAAGKSERFEALEPHLTGDPAGQPYAELATKWGTTEGAIKQEMHRLKKRYRDVVREEVAKTVALSSEVDDEITYLMDVLGRS